MRQVMPCATMRPVDYLPGADMLTDRQREVCDYLAAGLIPQEIAEELGLTLAAVRGQLTGAYKRLGVTSYHQLLSRIIEELLP